MKTTLWLLLASLALKWSRENIQINQIKQTKNYSCHRKWAEKDEPDSAVRENHSGERNEHERNTHWESEVKIKVAQRCYAVKWLWKEERRFYDKLCTMLTKRHYNTAAFVLHLVGTLEINRTYSVILNVLVCFCCLETNLTWTPLVDLQWIGILLRLTLVQMIMIDFDSWQTTWGLIA